MCSDYRTYAIGRNDFEVDDDYLCMLQRGIDALDRRSLAHEIALRILTRRTETVSKHHGEHGNV